MNLRDTQEWKFTFKKNGEKENISIIECEISIISTGFFIRAKIFSIFFLIN